jgi:type IV pilus assembly protein PilC
MSTSTEAKKPKLNLREQLNKASQSKETLERKWVITQLDAEGKKVTKKVTAASRSRAKVQADPELTVVGIAEVKSLLQMEFGNTVKGSVLLQFTRQLASFTAAGIPVLEALTMLSQSSKSAPMRTAIDAMVDDVRDGGTLAHAASEHPHVFPPYYIAILGAAERTGDLSGTFETISVYLERDLNSSRAVKSAMYYPAVLTLLGVGAMVVMSTVVLPKFRTFFTSLNTDLPPATSALLAITDFIGHYWIALIGSIAALIAFFIYYRRTPAGALEIDKLVLKAPVFGQLLQLVALERFCRILASLNDTGVNLTDSLKLSAEVLGNKAYEQAVLKAREGVIGGQGLAQPLADAKMFPAEAVQIFRVGEQSGLLSLQLKHAANYYAGEVDYRLKNLTALIEPMVLLVIGGGTGFVAVALVSAMYGIYSSQTMGG